jgi:hypothetical protein
VIDGSEDVLGFNVEVRRTPCVHAGERRRHLCHHLSRPGGSLHLQKGHVLDVDVSIAQLELHVQPVVLDKGTKKIDDTLAVGKRREGKHLSDLLALVAFIVNALFAPLDGVEASIDARAALDRLGKGPVAEDLDLLCRFRCCRRCYEWKWGREGA